MISCQQEHIKLTSPNGKLSLEFTLDEEGAPRYCLRHAGKNILLPSRLGLDFEGCARSFDWFRSKRG